jgi:hypothetical protein
LIFPLLLLASVPVALLVLLALVLRDPRKLANSDDDSGTADQVGQRHVSYFPQVRRALASEDLAFLASRGSRELTNRVRRERRKIGLDYLANMRLDFLKLWRLARVIASMSPQVGVAQELARLRLGLAFSMRYEVVRIKFFFGFAPLPELGFLSDVVSRLSFRLETAMNNLGERAALAAKLASSLDDGHGLNTP